LSALENQFYFSISSGRLIDTLEGHEGPVDSIALSEKYGIIVSGSSDRTIRLWDINGGGLINTIYLLPEGEWVTIGSENEIISGNARKYASLGINLTNFPIQLLTSNPTPP